ncbi:hypothetical protein MIU24_32560 [Streptomyces venezuelae]|uniref:hypothetical protein n=1 Tax=Streptomyces sp. B6(2022) TaxID=3404749 RepID=UPI00311F927A
MSWRDRQERNCLRELAAIRILDDLRTWQSTHDRRTCEALYNLPAHQPARKETGQ